MRGFSLTEVLLALAIIAILVFFTAPSHKEVHKKIDTLVIRNELLQAIRLARNEAMLRSEMVGVVISPDKIQLKNANTILNSLKIDTHNGVFLSRFFPNYFSFLKFNAEGSTLTENGTIWYCDEKKQPQFAVIISKSGRERVVLPNNINQQILDQEGKPLTC